MSEITIHAPCGNTSKKLVLRDLNIAFAKSDAAGILEHLTDDIRWQIVGAALEAMKDVRTTEPVIHSIITHGAEGVVNGVITTEEGGAIAFCDVYRFASASGTEIESMISYAIELPSGG